MIARVLRRGSRGDDVAEWQLFLIGQHLNPGNVDAIFGGNTHTATIDFQKAHALKDDGVVGRDTLAAALQLGFGNLPDPEDTDEAGPNWPPPPDFSAIGLVGRQALFGKFDYVADPLPGDREHIRILGAWETQNIVTIEVPQLIGIKGANERGQVTCHRLVADQILAVFAAWGRARLLDRVLTWDGCYNPRFIRGSDTTLSPHAFGTAFDINAEYNAYGVEPRTVGKTGAVRELVEIANDLKLFWGGHFSGRQDGMHFEVSQLVELADPIPVIKANAAPSCVLDATTESPSKRTPGSTIYDKIWPLTVAEREQAICKAIIEDLTPQFQQSWQEVRVSAVDAKGVKHTGVIKVLPDYLAVGTDEDFIRVPVSPLSAQRIADALGCVLPTTKIVDDVYRQAALRLAPQPLPACAEMTSMPYFKRHNDRIEAQRSGRGTGQLIAGHKKDVVITNRLMWKARRVAIYGWHTPDGKPIQSLSTLHEETYADYSHGIRLIKDTMQVDGEQNERLVSDVLQDPMLHVLLSDEGALKLTAYKLSNSE